MIPLPVLAACLPLTGTAAGLLTSRARVAGIAAAAGALGALAATIVLATSTAAGRPISSAGSFILRRWLRRLSSLLPWPSW